MILDKQNLFSENQAITASAASTNVIDLGATDSKIQTIVNKSGMAELFAQVMVDFATCTSLTIGVQTDDDEAFGTAVTLSSQTIALAALLAGTQFNVMLPKQGLKRYVRLYYTIAGSNATAGKMTAGIVLDSQMNGI